MPRTTTALLTAFALSALAPLFGADEPPTAPRPMARLLSFDELQKRLGTPGLRLIDVRPKAEYERSHIPGAVWADTKAAVKTASAPGGLNDREAWSAWTAPLAIAPGDEVVVYDGARQLEAARVWWLLGYLGVEKVGLVDGNFPLWEREKRPVTDDAPEVDPRPFPVSFRAERLATREQVREASRTGAVPVVDARSAAEYVGSKVQAKRGGHVPGACHLEWSELVDQDGRFLGPSALRARLDALGLKPGASVITHCQGGGRASVDAFALERLGFSARNYYPGWSDWGNLADTPVVTGAKPAGPR
jgi:thiosulfate/3-mercaptopyruvate sulfurtransferase